MAEDPLTTHARARVGRLLRGKWTLDRLIGVGGMAAVYEATHRNGSKVAIKMLHPTLMYDTNFAQRLVQEGYVANKINHAAAVKVFDDDTDETDGTVFLVMELLEGQTLSQARRKKKRFPPVEAFKMLIPVLECLGNAHERGIIHRDIKPENLFMTRDGVVHVLDFGIARVSDGSNVSATRTGMVVGSPAYMSPEQALGKMNSVGPQTDVYAVGATMFALLAGATPHAGESTQEMIVMVATQAARPITSVAPDLPASVARIVDKSLAYDRDKRYPNARAMLEDVRAVIAELEGTPRVLPTFADEEEEGETTVNAALQPSGDNKAAPLPAAGLNRVGQRPQTGKFNVPAAAPAPIADALGGLPPPAPMQNKPAEQGRLRPPTMAPIGAPASPNSFQPAIQAPPSLQSGPHPLPGTGSGQHSSPGPTGAVQGGPAGAFSSGAHMAPPAFGDPQQNDAGNGLPPTMAIPMINPLDMPAPAGPGVSSGPRPGATTNMVWATPPSTTPEETPPARKPRTGLLAAAAVGVLALGGIGFAAFGGAGSSPQPPPPVRQTRPQPQIAQQPPVVTAPPSTQTPPSPPSAPLGAAHTEDAGATTPSVAQQTPPEAHATPTPDPPVPANTETHTTAETPAATDNSARNAHRPHRDRPQGTTPTATPTHTTTRRNRPGGHARDPLGY
jgi:eukaryotic-like serine/threonine-protein kinase